MSKVNVPKKYAPKDVPPRALGSPPDVTQFKPLLDGYYYNIEQAPTMKHHTKKCYLYNIISSARSIVAQHFKLTSDEKQSWEVDFAIVEAVRVLEKVERGSVVLEYLEYRTNLLALSLSSSSV